jgi:MFS family permease
MQTRNQLSNIILFILLALILRFFVVDKILYTTDNEWLQVIAIAVIFIVGIGYIFMGTTKVIEETTDVLKDRTGLAGGFLQALGTAFPDMIIGVMAAILSLEVRGIDYPRAVNLAIIAASATFGSNIYNIVHAAWCVYRQNLADKRHETILMFPFLKFAGTVKPMSDHKTKPSVPEIDSTISILTALSLLTAFVAVSMVLFGQVPKDASLKMPGDLYELVQPVGVVLFIFCVTVLYIFRKNEHPISPDQEIITEERYYAKHSTSRIWFDLILSGIAILLTAESMVKSLEVFSNLTHIPFVVTGIMAGIIGCFGEMMVVHNFSINPNGRIGDAISGVAMDNIMTTLGASLVAIMGGIFLGGNALIVIFIVILTANTLLIEQITKLRNRL